MRRLLLALLLVAACRTAAVVPPRAEDFGPITKGTLEALACTDPLDEDVEVRLADLTPLGLYGRSSEGPSGYWIEVNDRVPDEYQQEVLIHEWAHCRARHKLAPGEDAHGPTWGVEYAVAFRCLRGMPFPVTMLPLLPR